MTGDDVIDMVLTVWDGITDPRNADLGELAWNIALLAVFLMVAGFLFRVLFDFLVDLWKTVVLKPYQIAIRPAFNRIRYVAGSGRRKREREEAAERDRKWNRYQEAKREYEKWEREEEEARKRWEILEALKINK